MGGEVCVGGGGRRECMGPGTRTTGHSTRTAGPGTRTAGPGTRTAGPGTRTALQVLSHELHCMSWQTNCTAGPGTRTAGSRARCEVNYDAGPSVNHNSLCS